jgi:hypothetical protein
MAVSKSWRGLVSLIMFSSMFISAITGLILYIVPEGRVANWVLWDMLGISKSGWQGIHTFSSFLLLVFSVFHLINNWGSVKNYVVKKAGGLNQVGNMAAVAIISVIIVISGAFFLPPLQWIMDGGDAIKQMWVGNPDFEPPFGHAEELSLAAFGRRMNIDADQAVAELRKAGLQVENKKQSLAEVALANNSRPMDVYLVIKHLENTPKLEEGKTLSAVDVETMFGAGTGAGRKSVEEIAKAVNIPIDLALERLEAAGISASAESKLRDLKDANELKSASQVVLIMLDITE